MAIGPKYNNITSATTTQVRSGKGKLIGIVVNQAVANGTITIVDNTSGSTPTIGTITAPATLLQNHYSLPFYGLEFSTGLRIITTQAQNVTVIYE